MKKKIIAFSLLALCLSLSLMGQAEMLGKLTREDILKNYPDWQEVVAASDPKPDVIEKLRLVEQPVQIEIYLGTWCPDSKAQVSAYFKILDMADNPLLQTAYIGIPRDKAARPNYVPEGKNIVKLPTFIIYLNDQEKGRIIETPTKSVEEDLLDIITK